MTDSRTPSTDAAPDATAEPAGGGASVLVILNDAPYGSERAYNGLRLVNSLARRDATAVRLFLIGDAVACAKAGQTVPAGYYNVETMLARAIASGATVGVCGSCMDARGLDETELVAGARRSSMDELTCWTLETDRVVAF